MNRISLLLQTSMLSLALIAPALAEDTITVTS
jgi:putative spermidine/putrescine transport system substrate-binding protein